MKPLFFCGIIFILASGCEKNNNTGTSSGTDIFPNKIGDTWVYLVNDTTFIRSNHQDFTVDQYHVTVSVVDSVQLADGTKANTWIFNYPQRADTNYVFQKGDTIRFIDVNQTIYAVYARQYVIPMVLHDSWKYTVPGFQNVTVDRQSNLIIGQNHFDNAFHIFGTGGMPDASFMIDEWFENNVGVVKRYINPSGELIDTIHITSWSLVNYNLR